MTGRQKLGRAPRLAAHSKNPPQQSCGLAPSHEPAGGGRTACVRCRSHFPPQPRPGASQHEDCPPQLSAPAHRAEAAGGGDGGAVAQIDRRLNLRRRPGRMGSAAAIGCRSARPRAEPPHTRIARWGWVSPSLRWTARAPSSAPGAGALHMSRSWRMSRSFAVAVAPGGAAALPGRSKIAQHFSAGLPVRNRNKSGRDDRIPPARRRSFVPGGTCQSLA